MVARNSLERTSALDWDVTAMQGTSQMDEERYSTQPACSGVHFGRHCPSPVHHQMRVVAGYGGGDQCCVGHG
jgi:hypothetical protein